MRILVWICAVYLISSILTLAHSGPSLSADRERSALPPLSAQETQDLLTGQSMGFADVAERHQYPGPTAVLDLASQLHLSERQRAAIQQIDDHRHAEAVRLGRRIVDQEQELQRVLAGDELAWLMAAVPMAFIGWIGTGVLKARPTMILNRPKLTRTPTGSILVSVI